MAHLITLSFVLPVFAVAAGHAGAGLLQYLAQSAQKDPQSVLIVSTKAAVPDVVRRPFSDRRERIWNSFIIKVPPW
jgi:sirohydrochlorin ferrochelatase